MPRDDCNIKVVSTVERKFTVDGEERKVGVSTLEDGSFGLEFTTSKKPEDIRRGKLCPIADAIEVEGKIMTRVRVSRKALKNLRNILLRM